jgi:hypothetical protein
MRARVSCDVHSCNFGFDFSWKANREAGVHLFDNYLSDFCVFTLKKPRCKRKIFPYIMTFLHEPHPVALAAGVLGHPAMGIAWLANKLARFDRGLQPGQIVFLHSAGMGE